MKIAPLFLLLFVLACKPKQTRYYNTSKQFIEYVQNNDWQNVQRLLKFSFYYNDTPNTIRNTQLLQNYFAKYGIPEEKKWSVKYDSVSAGIFIIRWIEIPIFKGYDPTDSLELAILKLGFDATGKRLPDSIILTYDLILKKRTGLPDLR